MIKETFIVAVIAFLFLEIVSTLHWVRAAAKAHVELVKFIKTFGGQSGKGTGIPQKRGNTPRGGQTGAQRKQGDGGEFQQFDESGGRNTP